MKKALLPIALFFLAQGALADIIDTQDPVHHTINQGIAVGTGSLTIGNLTLARHTQRKIKKETLAVARQYYPSDYERYLAAETKVRKNPGDKEALKDLRYAWLRMESRLAQPLHYTSTQSAQDFAKRAEKIRSWGPMPFFYRTFAVVNATLLSLTAYKLLEESGHIAEFSKDVKILPREKVMDFLDFEAFDSSSAK